MDTPTANRDSFLKKYEVTFAVADALTGIDPNTKWSANFYAENYAHAEEQAEEYRAAGELIYMIERYF